MGQSFHYNIADYCRGQSPVEKVEIVELRPTITQEQITPFR